jgi:DNA topoisomerase-2
MASINTKLAKMEMQILQRFFLSSSYKNNYLFKISGLGTSTAKEAKEYFSNMDRHRIIFKYDSIKDDLAIQLAFNSALSDDRKDWIKWHTEDVNQRREQNLPADYLYKKDTKQINFNDFINKELVLFSKSSTERAIPSIMVN